jgi:RNA-binding protein
MKLSEKNKKQLRKLGHDLHPLVTIADQGLKETVIAATEEALSSHELIKIRLRGANSTERKIMLQELCEKTQSELVSSIGFTALLFRRNQDKPRIVLER